MFVGLDKKKQKEKSWKMGRLAWSMRLYRKEKGAYPLQLMNLQCPAISQ